MPPIDYSLTLKISWIDDVWRGIIDRVRGNRVLSPVWYRRPAVGRCTISSPDILKAFAAVNKDKSYRDQIKPSNFVLTAHVEHLGHLDGIDPARFQLFAPFETNPERWLTLHWQDKYSGRSYRIGVGTKTHPGLCELRRSEKLVADHRMHPEAKSADAKGRACTKQTVGLLFRRPIEVKEIVYIRKEANSLQPPRSRSEGNRPTGAAAPA